MFYKIYYLKTYKLYIVTFFPIVSIHFNITSLSKLKEERILLWTRKKPKFGSKERNRKRSSISEPSLNAFLIISSRSVISYLRFSVSFSPSTDLSRNHWGFFHTEFPPWTLFLPLFLFAIFFSIQESFFLDHVSSPFTLEFRSSFDVSRITLKRPCRYKHSPRDRDNKGLRGPKHPPWSSWRFVITITTPFVSARGFEDSS